MACEYCDVGNTEEGLRGSDGIVFDKAKGKHYLYAEHFRNEAVRIDVTYCPQCGDKFNESN